MDRLNFTPFPTLRTNRLLLRKPIVEDASSILDLRSDELVNRYIDRSAYSTDSESRQFLLKIIDGIENNEWIYWILCFPDEQELIGTICLWNFSDSPFAAEIGFELLPKYHRNGLMKEAMSVVLNYGFNNIRLEKINAFTHSQNEGAIRTLKNYNFNFEKDVEQLHSLLNIPYVANIYSLQNPQ